MSLQLPDSNNAGPLYEVLIVKYGTRSARRSEVYLNYAIYGEPDGPIEMDYFFWVVRNDTRTVVVDTGYSVVGGSSRQRTTLVSPPDAFAALGIPTDASTTVVLTHAHYDHSGNIDYFPSSTIVMSTAERAFWSGPIAQRRQFHHSAEDPDLAVIDIAAAEGRVLTFTGTHALAEGIELIEVGGHTPGQLVVKVATSEGSVLLASDAVHYYEELESDMPFTYVADLPRMYEGFDRISRMIVDGTVQHVVSGHDPSTLSRFTPHDSVLPGLVSVIGQRGNS